MRVFIAVELSPGQKKALESLQSELKKDLKNIKWVAPGNLHVTMKFLGETSPEELMLITNDLQTDLHNFSSFPMDIEGTGVFPGREKARVFWAGINGGREGLVKLNGIIEKVINKFPEISPGKQNNKLFSPHITMGRFRQPPPAGIIKNILEQTDNFKGDNGYIESISIYKSTLMSAGPRYDLLQKIFFS